MKKGLITGLVVLCGFAALAVVVTGAPGMSGDSTNGTTDEEGLTNSTYLPPPPPSPEAVVGVASAGVTSAEPSSDLDQFIEQEKKEYEIIKAFLQGRLRCYLAKKWW
jgi:hypothetical protein